MAISKKRKRKIVVNKQEFYWYIGKDPHDKNFAKALHIVSPAKDFLVIYRLDFITEGSVFPKLEVIRSCYIKTGFYNLNEYTHEQEVTPKFVGEIILFCLSNR
ncbi:hypothetical protein O0882_12435 [Janthinobacterium sp. SUN073]|uniref:hypothetical protein n=1 Tax=Janthinobacterium sp. SUN073 TaxID=3004102 RepID=UPI0025B18E73|nr:hypothetical protein [Janthinobacterium sp. SUN073]MDN2697124.1 hypothetical protein [Janthinobacterium sp. SUN073]